MEKRKSSQIAYFESMCLINKAISVTWAERVRVRVCVCVCVCEGLWLAQSAWMPSHMCRVGEVNCQ